MSFALEVKEEIVKHDFSESLAKAFLSGFIKYNMKLIISDHQFNFEINSISNGVIRQLYSLIRKIYHVPIEVKVLQSDKDKYHKNFVLKIKQQVQEILTDLQVFDFHKNQKIIHFSSKWSEQKKRAYLAGVFVACGSVNSPETSNYHLEVQFYDEASAYYFCEQTLNFGFKFKITTRFEKYVCYIKKSILVSDFLKLIDAVDNVLKFEDTRILRDLTNSINRLNNIEISNQQKTFKAAEKQVIMITYLQNLNILINLSESLQNIAELRLKHQDLTLHELADLYYQNYGIEISKSGINHLFRKLRQEYEIVKNS